MEDGLGGSRKLAIGLWALGALAASALFLLLRPVDAQAVQPVTNVAPGNYVGVATCGGTTCHGRSQGDGPRVRQDEIMLWQDPATAAGAHSRAYAVLREPRSRAIAERLGIGEASYVGVATCGGTTCHGRSRADGEIVRQDEIQLWQDPATAAGPLAPHERQALPGFVSAVIRGLRASLRVACKSLSAHSFGDFFGRSEQAATEDGWGAAASWRSV